MIYTVTFNPSLDYIVSVEDFKLGLTNRTSSELMRNASGKDQHVTGSQNVEFLQQLLHMPHVLTYHPFLVKPNNHELGEIFGAELKTREEVIPYAKKMQEMGAVNVLVSMAGEGAVLAAGDGPVCGTLLCH